MTAPGARNPDPAGALAAACPPRPRVGCWACLGLWLIVLVRRLCYCLPDRVRPRPASGTRAPSEDASDLCTRLDPGGSIVDGLASGGVHHWCGLCRSFRVAPAGFRPGTRPAHPGPARRRMSAVVFQVPGELGGGGPGCRGLGVEDRLPSPRRAPAGRHVDRLAHQDWCRLLSPQSHNRPLSWCSSPGTVARYTSPSQVLIQVDAAHPLHPGPVGGGSPRLDRVGTRDSGPGGPGGGAGSFRRGRGLAGPGNARAGAHRLAAHAPAPTRPQGRGDAPVPAGLRPRHRAQS